MAKLQETEKIKPENSVELQVVQEGIKVVAAVIALAEEEHRKCSLHILSLVPPIKHCNII